MSLSSNDIDGAATPTCTVLLVEDEPLIALDIETLLQSLGCHVLGPFAQLSQAMAALANATIGCAILDVNVRGGHTTALVEILLDRGTPILLTSGYEEVALPERLQGQFRLRKPYTSLQLEEGIIALFRRSEQCSGLAESVDAAARDQTVES